jgi:hypothetical protein
MQRYIFCLNSPESNDIIHLFTNSSLKHILIYPKEDFRSNGYEAFNDYKFGNATSWMQNNLIIDILSTSRVNTSISNPIFILVNRNKVATVAISLQGPSIPIPTHDNDKPYTFTPNAISFEIYSSGGTGFEHIWGTLHINDDNPDIQVVLHESYGVHNSIVLKNFEPSTVIPNFKPLIWLNSHVGGYIPLPQQYLLASYSMMMDKYQKHTSFQEPSVKVVLPDDIKLTTSEFTMSDISFMSNGKGQISIAGKIGFLETVFDISREDPIVQCRGTTNSIHSLDLINNADIIPIHCSSLLFHVHCTFVFSHTMVLMRKSVAVRIEDDTQVFIPGFTPKTIMTELKYITNSEMYLQPDRFNARISIGEFHNLNNRSCELYSFLEQHDIIRNSCFQRLCGSGTIQIVEYKLSQDFRRVSIVGLMDSMQVTMDLCFDDQKAWLRSICNAFVDGQWIYMSFKNDWFDDYSKKLYHCLTRSSFVDVALCFSNNDITF